MEPRTLLANVPPGFVDAQIASGLTSPTAIDVAPDGRVFAAQQNGVIRVVQNDQLLSAPFADLSAAVDSSNERGMLGLTIDPFFDVNQYVYVYYTAKLPTAHNRISRFVANGNVAAPGSETVLVDFPDMGSAIWHMGGAIHFGPDGKLYAGVGDHQQPNQSQLLTSVFGKILRFNPDGSIPSDNPFYSSTTGTNRAIWCYGLRNPFTFSFQPGTSRLFINDVGLDSWEEINQGAAGANYGWPTTEGDFNQSSFPSFTRPIYAYPHSVGQCIAGATFYAPQSATFPAQYYNKFFFVDFVQGFMKTIDPVTKVVSDFASALSFPTDAHVSASGAIYYLQRGMDTGEPTAGSGSLRKLDYVTSTPPGVVQQPTDQSGAVGQQVTFAVSALGTSPLSYQWRQNGTNISGANGSTYSRTVTAGDAGAVFSCFVSNSFGQATSNGATLT
ncbi:MAG: PQQ-dependent sugar dehydrogenase, partial [Tepidisphaeraceae bacterium]